MKNGDMSSFIALPVIPSQLFGLFNIKVKVIVRASCHQMLDLLSVGHLVVVRYSIYHCGVICRFNDNDGSMDGHTANGKL